MQMLPLLDWLVLAMMRLHVFIVQFLIIRSTIEDCGEINNVFVSRGVSVDLILEHCRSAVESLSRLPSLPRDIVRNDVFPFTVLTEDPFTHLEWRDKFLTRARTIASSCLSVDCIALEMNREIYDITDPPIIFEAAPPNELNSYSVMETIEKKKGSCTAMSVVLITALRMAGVASRIVGVPHWNLGPSRCPEGDASEDCGNHNWVEVFVPNHGWSFIDQRRPDLKILPLNQSWFYPEFVRANSHVGQGNHSVYAASFLDVQELENSGYYVGKGVEKGDHFPMVWDWSNHQVHAWDVSRTYSSEEEKIYTIEEA